MTRKGTYEKELKELKIAARAAILPTTGNTPVLPVPTIRTGYEGSSDRAGSIMDA